METSALTDARWEQLWPLLPPQKPRTGRLATDHRTVVNGILWVLRTGSPWRSLPERFGLWKTVSSRFYRLKQWRRIATRYEKRAANFVAMVTVAAILLWL